MSLNNGKVISFVVIGVMIISVLPLSAQGLTAKKLPDYSSGDFFKFEMNVDEFIDAIGESGDATNYTHSSNIEITKSEIRITGEELMNVGGTGYVCFIYVLNWDFSFELNYNEASTIAENGKFSHSMKISEKSWASREKFQVVKKEFTHDSDVRFTYNGTEYIFQLHTTETRNYIQVGGGIQFPLTVGSTWSETERFIENTTIRTRNDSKGEWDVEYEEHEETITTEYEVISENSVTVGAGTFNTLKIREEELGDANYSVSYYDINWMPIKEVLYAGDGTPLLSMNLQSYSLANEIKSNDGGSSSTPGFEAITLLTATAMITVFRRKRAAFHAKGLMPFSEATKQG